MLVFQDYRINMIKIENKNLYPKNVELGLQNGSTIFTARKKPDNRIPQIDGILKTGMADTSSHTDVKF